MRGQHLVGRMLDVMGQRLDPRTVGRAQVLRGGTPADREPGVVVVERSVGGESGLADARLTGHEHDPPPPVAHLAGHSAKPLVLFGSSNVGNLRDRPQDRREHRPPNDLVRAQRLPAHRKRLRRLGDALQLQHADGLERESLTPPDQHLRRSRDEDPVARRLVAQTRRLDRRHAEVIAALDRRLAGCDSDPQMQLLFRRAVAPFHQLLHVHAALHRARWAGEGHHEAIAGVLDLLSLAGFDRTAQNTEMLSPQLIGPRRAHPRFQPRRAHQVGDQNRCKLDRSQRLSSRSVPMALRFRSDPRAIRVRSRRPGR